MATRFTVTHEINCDAETYWKLFFDKEFNQALYKGELGFPRFTIDEQREGDKEIYRKVSAEPKVDLPGPLKKILGSSFSYVEEGTYDRAGKIWRFKTVSSLGDKMKNDGTMRVEPLGPGKCRRVGEISLEAKMFGVGGMLESTGEKELRKGWDQSAIFTNRWIADGKLK